MINVAFQTKDFLSGKSLVAYRVKQDAVVQKYEGGWHVMDEQGNVVGAGFYSSKDDLKKQYPTVKFQENPPMTIKSFISCGTPFQQKVWKQLLTIPKGQTRTYGDIAKAIGKPKASRAVGGAVGANPLCPYIPCHRVVGSQGNLGGFAYGIDIKKKLLQGEGVSYAI